MIKFFKKSKKLFYDHFGPFLPENESVFLCQFLNIPIIYYRVKNQKKLMTHSSEKCRTDRRIDRRTDEQTDNGDFIGPSKGRGSNNDIQKIKPKIRFVSYIFRGALSRQRQLLATGSPLKSMENAFYLTSKAPFVLKIFKFLS